MTRFVACPTCHGEGSVTRRPRRRRRADGTFTAPKITSDPCKNCANLGVVPNDACLLERPLVRPTRGFVAIVGCGIGGAALALALAQRNVPHRVFERDPEAATRTQGYSLTMQQGAMAMGRLGIAVGGTRPSAHLSFLSDGTKIGRYGREVYFPEEQLSEPCGERLTSSNRVRQNVQLPRQRLRALLLRELRRGTVEWSRRFMDYEMAHDGSYTLRFEDGAGDTIVVPGAAVVIGCDGVHSAVARRKFGPERARLNFLGLVVILGIASLEDASLHHRVTQTLDGQTRIYTMPFLSNDDVAASEDPLLPLAGARFPVGVDVTMWQLSFPATLDEAEALRRRGGAGLKAEALRRCGAWRDPLPALLRATRDEDVTGYPVFDREPPSPLELRGGSGDSGVTILGDAAHPMSPFKGQGANQALADAVSLARCLATLEWDENYLDSEALDGALARFERDMLARAGEKVTASRTAAEFLHSTLALTPANCVRSVHMFERMAIFAPRSERSPANVSCGVATTTDAEEPTQPTVGATMGPPVASLSAPS